MNPHQQNKVDVSKLTEQEAKLFRLYGKLPNKKDLLQNKLKERKYFDSGDYALSKAGKASDIGVTQVGREHPNPEKIPHIAPSTPIGQNGSVSSNGNSAAASQGDLASSPVKEHTFLHRETSLNRETSASEFENEISQDAQGGPVKA
ncbi:endosulphine family protein [Bipolaris maydis]|nr:endosulphine family protein [Bipolaris maydis]KAJ6284802.1 camp-regulated phosphoprotein/endosulfine conserved region-domain-containing protein [Bipolaris maydis]